MKVGSKKWHLVVPVHQSNSEACGRFTDYMIAKELLLKFWIFVQQKIVEKLLKALILNLGVLTWLF